MISEKEEIFKEDRNSPFISVTWLFEPYFEFETLEILHFLGINPIYQNFHLENLKNRNSSPVYVGCTGSDCGTFPSTIKPYSSTYQSSTTQNSGSGRKETSTNSGKSTSSGGSSTSSSSGNKAGSTGSGGSSDSSGGIGKGTSGSTGGISGNAGSSSSRSNGSGDTCTKPSNTIPAKAPIKQDL